MCLLRAFSSHFISLIIQLQFGAGPAQQSGSQGHSLEGEQYGVRAISGPFPGFHGDLPAPDGGNALLSLLLRSQEPAGQVSPQQQPQPWDTVGSAARGLGLPRQEVQWQQDGLRAAHGPMGPQLGQQHSLFGQQGPGQRPDLGGFNPQQLGHRPGFAFCPPTHVDEQALPSGNIRPPQPHPADLRLLQQAFSSHSLGPPGHPLQRGFVDPSGGMMPPTDASRSQPPHLGAPTFAGAGTNCGEPPQWHLQHLQRQQFQQQQCQQQQFQQQQFQQQQFQQQQFQQQLFQQQQFQQQELMYRNQLQHLHESQQLMQAAAAAAVTPQRPAAPIPRPPPPSSLPISTPVHKLHKDEPSTSQPVAGQSPDTSTGFRINQREVREAAAAAHAVGARSGGRRLDRRGELAADSAAMSAQLADLIKEQLQPTPAHNDRQRTCFNLVEVHLIFSCHPSQTPPSND